MGLFGGDDAYFYNRLAATILVAVESFVGAYYDFKYLDIADNYYDIYADEFEFWHTTFRPRETTLASEVFATPIENPNYAEADGYTYAASLLLNDYYERFRGYFFASTAEFGERDQTFERTGMFIDYNDFTRRYVEARRDARNERRHDRQADQLNIGLKQQAVLGRSLEHGVASYLGAVRDTEGTIQGIALDIGAGYAYKAGVLRAERTLQIAVDSSRAVRPDMNTVQSRPDYPGREEGYA